MAKRSVVVYVGGQRYVVRSDADETYIQTLAGYVDDRLKEVQRGSKPVSPQSLTMLAALNIADELFQTRAAGGKGLRGLPDSARDQRLCEILDGALAG